MVKKTSKIVNPVSDYMQTHEYNLPAERKMLEPTVISWFFKLFLPPMWVYLFIQNLDNIKSTILFILFLIVSMWRLWRGHLTSRQNKRLKDLQIRREELAQMREEVELKERSLRYNRTIEEEERDEY